MLKHASISLSLIVCRTGKSEDYESNDLFSSNSKTPNWFGYWLKNSFELIKSGMSRFFLEWGNWSTRRKPTSYQPDLGLPLVSPWCWDFGNWLKASKKIWDVSLCFEVSKRPVEYLTRVRYAATWKRACEIARVIAASVSTLSFSLLQGFWRMEA